MDPSWPPHPWGSKLVSKVMDSLGHDNNLVRVPEASFILARVQPEAQEKAELRLSRQEARKEVRVSGESLC